MKKVDKPETNNNEASNLLPEYDIDYRKARLNRFADRIDPDQVMIALDPDVAEVYTTAESVNSALRSLMTGQQSNSGSR